MNISSLQKLLATENQEFLCRGAGEDAEKSFVSKIVHEVSAGFSDEDLEQIKNVVGQESELIDLFKCYGSIELYCDTLSGSSAYYIAHPTQWPELHDEFTAWIQELSDEERKEYVPSWVENALVIGEKSSSGNYYLLVTEGNEKGQVFEFEHDGFEFIKASNSLEGLIEKLTTINDDLLCDISGHTRYSDGITSIQWIPIKYQIGKA